MCISNFKSITIESLNFSNSVMCKFFLLLIVCGFSLCSPHSHKKLGNQETVEHGAFNPRDSHHYKNGIHDNEFDHESVLGSHHAAEEFDHLPPEEAKKRLFSLALKMDTDGDKYVDRKELINWVLRSFKLLTEEEAMDDFEDRDADEDGIVTWEEHFAETFGLSDDDLDVKQDKSSEELKMLEDDKELFHAADLNGDGMLDKTEYPAYSTPEEFEHMHQVVYQQAMRKRDLNKDGFLSFDEFIANNYDSSAPVPTTKHYAIEKDLFKNEYDLNGDNKLSKEEVLLWLIPNDVETAENEADHLIERSDSDSDGKLSIQEIVDNHDIFVGSEATSFGEQLQTHRSYDEL